jgi:hypothetical protein
MAGDPQLDCLTLTCGDAQALLIDPRDQGDRLASRYCQGGWVLDWRVGDRSLTDRPTDDFDPAIGQGLPEVFETGLGWGVAPVGGSYLRIGVGRCTRVDDGWCSNGTLAEPVEWSVAVDGTAEETSEAIFTCRDELTIGNRHFGYELERRITLQESGLISASTLTLQVPWSEPVAWFSHPFVPQHRGDATRIQLPGGARNLPELSEDGGFGTVSGLWGSSGPIILGLDGGGSLAMELDRPLDKAVVYASKRACSVEPYWCRAWPGGERASWALTYRWRP